MKHLTLLGIGIFAFNANAAWIGQYLKPNELTRTQKPVNVQLHDYDYHYQSALCVDTSPRAVPGKIWNGKCYVEWRGKEYSNTEFKVLVDEGYTWIRPNGSNKAEIMSRGVTPGVIDDGNYVYHCRIHDLQRNTLAVGKYIPSHNQCYYGYKGEGRTILDVGTIEVLVK